MEDLYKLFLLAGSHEINIGVKVLAYFLCSFSSDMLAFRTLKEVVASLVHLVHQEHPVDCAGTA